MGCGDVGCSEGPVELGTHLTLVAGEKEHHQGRGHRQQGDDGGLGRGADAAEHDESGEGDDEHRLEDGAQVRPQVPGDPLAGDGAPLDALDVGRDQGPVPVRRRLGVLVARTAPVRVDGRRSRIQKLAKSMYQMEEVTSSTISTPTIGSSTMMPTRIQRSQGLSIWPALAVHTMRALVMEIAAPPIAIAGANQATGMSDTGSATRRDTVLRYPAYGVASEWRNPQRMASTRKTFPSSSQIEFRGAEAQMRMI